MKTLIKLINDIKTYKLEINKIGFSGYWLNIYLKYKTAKGEVVSQLFFRDKYDIEIFLDWYRIEQQHKTKEHLISDNGDLTKVFDLFLEIRKRLNEEKVVTDKDFINKIQWINFTKYDFEIQPLIDWELEPNFVFYLVNERNKTHWDTSNKAAYKRLVNYLRKESDESIY